MGKRSRNNSKYQTSVTSFFLFALVLISSLMLYSVPCNAQNVGDPWAWGAGTSGQLGNGANNNSLVPVTVSGVTGISAIAGGYWHSLALTDSGSVLAWGDNEYGQLGNGNNSDSNIPIQVPNLTGVIAIAGGGYHSLALKNDGTVWAWGSNSEGQLGNATYINSNVPVQVLSFTGVIAIAGGFKHSIAIISDGTAWAWGSNSHGQLGIGSFSTKTSNVPVQVINLSGVTAIAGGYWHSLALKNDGTVLAWGYNGYGELGNGTYTQSVAPFQVSNLTGVTAIEAGYEHSVALKSNGTVWDWGYDGFGNGGPGSGCNSNVPVQVQNLNGITSIEGEGEHSLALKNDGTVWAWGNNNYGALGNNTGTPSSVPVRVSNLTGIVAIGEGWDHSLAIKSSACPTITISPSSLPSGTEGAYYDQAITASGGTPAYSYEVTSGSLPTGLMLSSAGDLSGTPTAEGTYNFTVTTTDADSCTGSKAYSVKIDPASCPTIKISPASLPNGTVGTAYSQGLSSSGGTSPYSYSTSSGTVPPGLALSSTGTLSGTPTASGGFSFSVTATDADSCTGNISYSVTISPASCPTIILSPSSLPSGSVDQSYSQTISATGGTSPYTYSVASGSLPPGLELSSGGVLAGIPTTAATFTFIVTAVDASGCTGSKEYSATISSGGIQPAITAIVKKGNPFRLKIYGSNFQPSLKVYIGGDSSPWSNVSFKSYNMIVLKGGNALKAQFPKGVPVEIKIVNGDGGTATKTYTR